MPLILQGIAGHPADLTGYLLIGRGVGTVGGLLFMSTLRDRIDPGPVFFVGAVLTVLPAWYMAQWTTEVRAWDAIWTNALQGLASTAIWSPLNTLALRGLQKRHQDTGFALFYLCFDMGSAVGTAAIISLHARNMQASHAAPTEAVNPHSVELGLASVMGGWSVDTLSGLAALEAEIGRQAAMIAFNNAFLLIAAVLALLGPLVLLSRMRGVAKGRRMLHRANTKGSDPLMFAV
jgi:DHA2 family multidrug resistance protein